MTLDEARNKIMDLVQEMTESARGTDTFEKQVLYQFSLLLGIVTVATYDIRAITAAEETLIGPLRKDSKIQQMVQELRTKLKEESKPKPESDD